MSRLEKPDFLIPATVAGFVYHEDKNMVGFQFVDPNGLQAFVALPGKLVAGFSEMISELLTQYPQIVDCVPPEPKRTH